MHLRINTELKRSLFIFAGHLAREGSGVLALINDSVPRVGTFLDKGMIY